MKQTLIDKYLKGESSTSEERKLLDLLLAVPQDQLSQDELSILQLLAYSEQEEDEEDIFSVDHSAEYDKVVKPARTVRMWPWAAAACAAGVLIMFLMPPRIEDSSLTSQVEMAMEATPTDSTSHQVTTPTVDPPTPPPTTIEEHGIATETVLPARTTQTAELAPDHNAQHASGNESAADSNQIQLPPILHPERLAYTPEEVEALKQRAKEKYLEWIQLEREIMDLEENNTANNIE